MVMVSKYGHVLQTVNLKQYMISSYWHSFEMSPKHEIRNIGMLSIYGHTDLINFN